MRLWVNPNNSISDLGVLFSDLPPSVSPIQRFFRFYDFRGIILRGTICQFTTKSLSDSTYDSSEDADIRYAL